jgi:hypothetical protein
MTFLFSLRIFKPLKNRNHGICNAQKQHVFLARFIGVDELLWAEIIFFLTLFVNENF